MPESVVARVGAISLALLANVGQLKANPALTWFPVDLTLVVTGVVVGSALWIRFQHGSTHKSILIPVALMAVFLLGLINSPFDGYATSKVVTLYSVTLACLVAPFYLLRSELQQRLFIYSIVAIGCAVATVLFIWPEYSSCVAEDKALCSTAIQFPGSETIGTARMTAAGFVVATLVATGSQGWRKIGLVGAAVLLLSATLFTGNRASLLAMAFALCVLFFGSPFFRHIRLRAIIVLSSSLVLIVVFQLFNGTSGERLLRLLTGAVDSSISTRVNLWEESLRHLQIVPWGIGWGEFPHLSAKASAVNLYPHNLIIEVLVEAGWLAGVALLATLVLAAWKLWRSADSLVLVVMGGLLAFTVVNAMISGDINSNRLMWMMIGFGLMQTRLRQLSFTAKTRPANKV